MNRYLVNWLPAITIVLAVLAYGFAAWDDVHAEAEERCAARNAHGPRTPFTYSRQTSLCTQETRKRGTP